MKCLIVSGGKAPACNLILKYKPFDLIIAADRGADRLLSCGIIPNVLVGDFDSLSSEKLAILRNANIKIIKSKAEKDFTDTECAFRYAMDLGCDDMVILGAFGTRIDHTLANINLLKILYDNDINCIMEDEKNRIILKKPPIFLKKSDKKFFSILAHSEEITGLNIIGAKYELNDYTLIKNSTVTISNEFVSETVKIDFLSGIALIIESND